MCFVFFLSFFFCFETLLFCIVLTGEKTQKKIFDLRRAHGEKKLSSAGGVLARTPDGRISCSNTLDARLAIAYAQKLPEIRAALFGEA